MQIIMQLNNVINLTALMKYFANRITTVCTGNSYARDTTDSNL